MLTVVLILILTDESYPYLVDSSSLLCAVCEVDCSAEVTSSRKQTSRSVASTYDFRLRSICSKRIGSVLQEYE